MAADPNPALRAELTAALAVLVTALRGLHNLAAMSTSADLAVAIAGQIEAKARRQQLINTVIANLDTVLSALNALQADGYPALPNDPLTGALANEVQDDKTDLAAAFALFGPQAVSVGLDVPNAIFGEQPVPPPHP